MTTASQTDELNLDPFDDELLQDPYPAYARLRADAPVVWNPFVRTWWVARYDDVLAGLASRTGYSAKTSVYQLGVTSDVDLGNLGRTNTLPTTDPPDHTRLRQIANKAFVPRAITDYRPRIRALVREYFDRAVEEDESDIVAGLAQSLPITIIAEILGVPPERSAGFKSASVDMMRAFTGDRLTPQDAQRATAAVRDLEELFEELRVQRQAEPREDLLTRLAEAEVDGDRLSRNEYLATCLLLMLGGNETTTNSIGSMFLLLATNPDQYRELRADPGLIEGTVEEALRLLGPVQWAVRRARQDIEIAGTMVPAGAGVSFLLASAGRDERHFPDAGRFDVSRDDGEHFAFGRGQHTCLGAQLARAEMQEALAVAAERCAALEITRPDAVRWGGSFQSRGLLTLPMKFRPA